MKEPVHAFQRLHHGSRVHDVSGQNPGMVPPIEETEVARGQVQDTQGVALFSQGLGQPTSKIAGPTRDQDL